MRILIVDDEKEISTFLKKSLEEECFSVDVAYTGEQGSYFARTNDYDIIILDNMMPGKLGMEVCKEIRAAQKAIPIIMLSVQSEVTTKIDLLNSGADDYMTKPFSFEELRARIHALLRRPQALEETLLSIDDLTLNKKKQQVARGNKTIYLTRKEFQLLEYLMVNKEMALSRGMIMEHVWNMECDPFSNTIEAHILNLRKKIDAGKKRKLIHSVPGRGYKIDTNR
jgi:two-component system, OmpR family, copper resistance phosphate regulon response regulator CusR